MKNYIAPNIKVIKVKAQKILAASGPTFSITGDLDGNWEASSKRNAVDDDDYDPYCDDEDNTDFWGNPL